jgi:hypothetical protein
MRPSIDEEEEGLMDRISFSEELDGAERSAGVPRNIDAEYGGREARRKLERKLLRKLDMRMSILVLIYVLNYVRFALLSGCAVLVLIPIHRSTEIMLREARDIMFSGGG